MVTGEDVLQYIDRYVCSDMYCIQVGKLDRAIQRSERGFFAECDPGNSELAFMMVPLSSRSGQFHVVLFTKFDALVPVALAPADRQLPGQERLLKATPLIEGIFNRADVFPK